MNSKESETLYKSLFNNALDGLAYCQMLFDKQGHPIDFVYLQVSKNFEKLTGLKRVIGKKVTELIPGIVASNPELFEVYGRVALTLKSERFEVYISSLARWFSISVYSPKKKFFVAVFQNITDRKRIGKDLEDARIAARNVLEDLNVEKSKVEMAKAKEEAILLSIGEGLLVTDEQGTIILINKIAEKLLGRKSAEVVGKAIFELILSGDQKGVAIPPEKHPVSRALSAGLTTISIATDSTYYYMRKDKTKFPVAITVTPVMLLGKVIGTIEVFRDITKEKEIDKAKTEFVSIASHQLRTPLTTISWYTEMILNGDVGKVNPDQKKYLNEIYQGNRRMITLVNTLLDVSRIELGTLITNLQAVQLKDIVEDVLNELKEKIITKNIILDKTYDPRLRKIQADPKLIRMILDNLFSNAVKYVLDNGKISIGISIQKKDILIKLWNNGPSIPEESQSKIFTKLFRDDLAKQRDPDGTGLGLYIAKSILDNSGGKIWFESQEKKGTTFYVTLPVDGAKK